MRTIIINTVKDHLQGDPLYFLPFRSDDPLWISRDLSSLAGCAEELSA